MKKLHHCTVRRSLAMLSIISGLAVSVALPQDLSAVDAPVKTEAISISPPSRSFTINAGSSATDTIKVTNNGDVAYDFTVYARPYSVTNELYDANYTEQKPNADVNKWVKLEKSTYHAEPGQTVEVDYSIDVPAGAAPGGHYGVVFAETKEKEIVGTGISRQKRIGKIIYATVNGDLRRSGEFLEFDLPSWQQNNSFTSTVRVKNTGNVDFDASIKTVAKDIFGNAKFTYTGAPKVLPGTTRLMDMKWEKAPSFGLYKIEQSVSFLDQKESNSKYVLLAPLWFPLAVVLLVAAVIGYFILKNRGKHTYRRR